MAVAFASHHDPTPRQPRHHGYAMALIFFDDLWHLWWFDYKKRWFSIAKLTKRRIQVNIHLVISGSAMHNPWVVCAKKARRKIYNIFLEDQLAHIFGQCWQCLVWVRLFKKKSAQKEHHKSFLAPQTLVFDDFWVHPVKPHFVDKIILLTPNPHCPNQAISLLFNEQLD